MSKIGFYAKKSKQYWTAPSIVCDDIAETCNEILEKLIKFKIKLILQPFIKTFYFVGKIFLLNNEKNDSSTCTTFSTSVSRRGSFKGYKCQNLRLKYLIMTLQDLLCLFHDLFMALLC